MINYACLPVCLTSKELRGISTDPSKTSCSAPPMRRANRARLAWPPSDEDDVVVVWCLGMQCHTSNIALECSSLSASEVAIDVYPRLPNLTGSVISKK